MVAPLLNDTSKTHSCRRASMHFDLPAVFSQSVWHSAALCFTLPPMNSIWRISLRLIALVLPLLCANLLLADDWPQWLGPQRDSIWRETGIVQKFSASGPPIRWRTPVGGGYSGPAVAQGRVYLTDRQLSQGASNPADPFQRGVIPGSERVLCLDEATGKILWHHDYDCPYSVSYPAGPRATPLVSDGKVYTLGAEGNLFCFNAKNGK